MRRYELLEELGRGAFGAVWRARLTGRGGFTREVAIKLLHTSTSSTSTALSSSHACATRPASWGSCGAERGL